ncbi:MAG: DNA primase [Spirochaetes bacterium]|nr:MAG: DNA primase [Spirochaetota bacterium]
MDAISFHTAGIDYAVAPLGTAFTSRQAQILARRTGKVLLCFDSDEAGKKAAERACSIAEAAGLNASVVMVGEGKDASEILEKSGVDALKKIPDYSISSGEFLIRRSEELFDMATVEGKSKASSFLYPYLDALGTEVKKNGFLEIVGRRLGINPTALLADYVKATALDMSHASRAGKDKNFSPKPQGSAARTADYFFMTALLLKPEVFPSVRESIGQEDFEDPRAREVFQALAEAWQNGINETASILPLIGDASIRRFVVSVAASGELDLDIDKVIKDGLNQFLTRKLEKERLKLTMDIAKASPQGSGQDASVGLLELLKTKMTLDKEISRLKGEVDE